MRSRFQWLAIAAALMLAWKADAEVEVAASQGEIRTLHAGTWKKVDIGDRLAVGHRVRTASAERVKLLFLDRVVVNLGPNSEIVIDEAHARGEGRNAIALRLLRGRLFAIVGEEFADPGSYFHVETGTAVATSRGGQMLVHYDEQEAATEVAELAGEAEVVSNVAALGGGKVKVPAGGLVRVRKGRLPGSVSLVGIEGIRELVRGIELLGTGRRDGLNVLHPLLAGRLLSPSDVPGGPRAVAASRTWPAAEAPEPALGTRLSADVYTNTQPIEVFRALPPGRPLGGDVRVEF